MARRPAARVNSFDRIAATLAALAVVGLVLYLLVRNEPIADPQLFVALRIVLSVGAAVLGATIPGFLQLDWKGGGLAVRAGGALALFVLTYVYTPGLVDRPPPPPRPNVSAPGGVAVGGDVTGGTFHIGAGGREAPPSAAGGAR